MEISGPAGLLEALLDVPAPGTPIRAAVVFAHPHPQYGGTMHTKAVFQGAKGLQRIGCAVLRFNFRGVGRSAGTFGGGDGERADFTAALDAMHARYPNATLWAAGFSFGSWVALEVGAVDPRVSALIAIAPPVPSREGAPVRHHHDYSFPNTLASAKPKFFIQGERDELCPLKDLWAFYAKLHEPKELVVIDAADHLFDGKTTEVADAMAELLE